MAEFLDRIIEWWDNLRYRRFVVTPPQDGSHQKGPWWHFIFRYKLLMYPIIIWLCLFSFFRYLQPIISTRSCEFPKGDNPYNILLISNPDLINQDTYPGYGELGLRIRQVPADGYIYKNYWHLIRKLQPQAVVIIGNLMDSGSKLSEDNYEHVYARFSSIFHPHKLQESGIDVWVSSPGNKDIGDDPSALARFRDHFGNPNQVASRADYDLVFLDTVSLEHDKTSADSKKFLGDLGSGKIGNPRILFTSAAMFKDSDTDELDKKKTDEVLNNVRPNQVISAGAIGKSVHQYTRDGGRRDVTEVGMGSISSHRTSRPSVGLMTLFPKGKTNTPGMEIERCELPWPGVDSIFYWCFCVMNVVFLIYRSCLPVRYDGVVIDEVYVEPKLIERLKGFQPGRFCELVVVEFVVVWGVYGSMSGTRNE